MDETDERYPNWRTALELKDEATDGEVREAVEQVEDEFDIDHD